jgi:hypothetical protein
VKNAWNTHWELEEHTSSRLFTALRRRSFLKNISLLLKHVNNLSADGIPDW